MARDLSVFTEDNAKWRSQRHRVPWRERVELIKQEFPAAMAVNWDTALRDEDVLGRVLKDILKVDQMEPGRSGPRPNLDYERGIRTWREMTGPEARDRRRELDFSSLAFPAAFEALAGNDSLSAIERKTSISRSRAHRLLRGQEEPTVDDFHSIAAAYGKQAAYFLEYRVDFILAAIATRLANRVEMTIAVYDKLTYQ